MKNLILNRLLFKLELSASATRLQMTGLVDKALEVTDAFIVRTVRKKALVTKYGQCRIGLKDKHITSPLSTSVKQFYHGKQRL